MSYIQVHEDIYLRQLHKAAPHTPQEPCTCDGSCKSDNCSGNLVGCDCDIDYAELNKLHSVEPILPMYNVRKVV